MTCAGVVDVAAAPLSGVVGVLFFAASAVALLALMDDTACAAWSPIMAYSVALVFFWFGKLTPLMCCPP